MVRITATARERALYLGGFPLGHLAVDWGGASLWLLAPTMAAAMGLSPFQVGLLFTLRMVGGTLAYLPAALVGHGMARPGVLLMSTLWWVSFTHLAASVAPGYWPIVVLLALSNAGSAAWHPVAMGIMVQRMPGRRAFSMAMHEVGGTIAEVLAPLSVGFLVAILEWRQVLQINAIPTIIVSLLFLRLAWALPRSSKMAVNISELGGIIETLRRPATLAILAVLFIYSMSATAMMAMTPLYLEDGHGRSSTFTGAGFAVMMLAGAVMGPLAGHLSDRLGRKSIALAALLGGGLFAALFSVASGAPGLLSSMILAGMLLLAARAVLMASALEMVGKSETPVLGFLFLVSNGGGALGALLGGLVGDVDLSYSIALVAALALAAAAVMVLHPLPSPTPSTGGATQAGAGASPLDDG